MVGRRESFAAGASRAAEPACRGRAPRAAAAGFAGVMGPARVLAGCVALALAASGCYAPQILLLKSGLDSLRTVVDTMVVRDQVAYQALEDTRREIASQRDILLSTRATAGSTTQEVFEQMGRLEGKLDEVMGRFQQITQRATPPPAKGPDPNQLYDEAAQDLTQGRYAMALRGFREFTERFPSTDLADNAQYGVGECFFAQSMFDSAAAEYERVGTLYPEGDRVPAALYKLALSQEKLGRQAEARKILADLVKRFPLSGEAQLARERLGAPRRR
jgi:tol-pal system protein YbgF